MIVYHISPTLGAECGIIAAILATRGGKDIA